MSVREQRAAHYATHAREMRARVAAPELRSAEDGTVGVVGYASVTDAPYTVSDQWGDYVETVERGAFGKSLREADDTRLLINHDGIPLARTKSGTLTLREISNPLDDPQGRGQTGLWTEALDLDPASPLVQTLTSAMRRGDLDEMSFAFQATRQTWNEDYTQRSIGELKLYDVSVVTYPANPATSAGLRSTPEVIHLPEGAKLHPLGSDVEAERAAAVEAQRRALELDRLASGSKK